ncbi:cilia- and flagella-associated protein 57 [Lingula anatina]|uniref:Cilia- and flagella-associated protein 57 n=1 Tax=Lingula anatina TaxID=7574 RepID=A0A1S3IR34_LINAN|nr:cilia- and flagella-associated protein 57 [Lingula anatina]|eukprot:XP_013398082.1 cilia- and flagella-associated protein 57 [Lingula anatina]
MSIAVAQARHIFGLKTGVTGNVAYQDEQTIIYPSGSNCVLYNIDQKAQKFIPGSEKSTGMTAMAVSPNRKYVAIAEKGEKATITIYDLHSQRRRKVLSSPEVQSGEYVSLAFSPDSKYLVAQGGKPDWTLLYWTWDKSKVMASIKTSVAQGKEIPPPVYQVTFNPQDNTQLCVVGNQIFKLYRYSEGSLKPFAFQKMEPQNNLCQAWVSDERVVVGTDNGRLLLFEAGELKNEFHVEKSQKGDKEKMDSISEGEATQPSGPPEITAIVAYSKGFACSVGPGTVFLYEKTDDKEYFKKAREIKIPADSNSADPSKSENQVITSLTVSPSEETLVASTDSSQLYSMTLSSADLGKDGQAYFEYLCQAFHQGQITGLDVCIRKALVATCGVDRSVRIWNFENCNLELYKEFAEEAYSIALHPSGLYVLVGFSDKLRLMNLLIDDIRVFKEFTIRGCRECAFSNGGHLFAAVTSNLIYIYSTATFENLLQLKGHNGKIRSVIWTADDNKLISCGMDGAVYEWDTFTGKRVGENVLKSCSYSSVAVTPDGKTTLAVGTDHTLKEISDSSILREVPAEDTTLNTVGMSHSGRMLFAGTNTGTLRSYKFPLTADGEWQEYQGHSSAITKMKITYDDTTLVTVSEDASIMLWKIQDKEGRGARRDKEVGWAEEILITKSDLEEKNTMMAELKTRVDELKTENEYQLRMKDMNYNEKIKELTEKFIQEMESLKTKNQVLKTDKDKEEAKHEEEVQEALEKHAKEMQDMESANNQKLMLEYEKYQDLLAKSQKMQEDYDRQLQEMEDSKERALEELTEYYETELQKKTTQLEEAHDQARNAQKEYEETKRQIEEDADREILDIKNRYERLLRDEKESNLRLKGESGIMKKKFTSLQKEIEDHKEEIKKNHTDKEKLSGVISNLEKDKTGLKKEIAERDETIQDKEKRIYDLKKKNQELEKFKFVLDYKIKELKKQIEPREKDIKDMKEQIQEMESELERFHKQNTQLELNITELRQKLKATDKEMHQERQKVRDREAMIKRFKTDLHNCVGYIQDPKMLKDSIKALYKKHVQEDITESASVDADIQKEYARQREHLERSVASLRKKLAKDTEIHRADNVRIMQENVSLIKEINDLRKELKIARTQVHDLEAALGLHRKNAAAEATATLQAVASQNKNAMLEKDLEESKRIVDMQKNEIKRLRLSIYELENVARPPSGGKLPPVIVQ